jgi:hypothetical protein
MCDHSLVSRNRGIDLRNAHGDTFTSSSFSVREDDLHGVFQVLKSSIMSDKESNIRPALSDVPVGDVQWEAGISDMT